MLLLRRRLLLLLLQGPLVLLLLLLLVLLLLFLFLLLLLLLLLFLLFSFCVWCCCCVYFQSLSVPPQSNLPAYTHSVFPSFRSPSSSSSSPLCLSRIEAWFHFHIILLSPHYHHQGLIVSPESHQTFDNSKSGAALIHCVTRLFVARILLWDNVRNKCPSNFWVCTDLLSS